MTKGRQRRLPPLCHFSAQLLRPAVPDAERIPHVLLLLLLVLYVWCARLSRVERTFEP